MIDDEVDGRQRVDRARIAAKLGDGVPHRGEIDHRRHAGEILHQHPRRPERDLAVAFTLREPERDAAYVVGGDAPPILVPEQILEQHLERERQQRNIGKPVRLRLLQAEIGVVALADRERAPAIEAVELGYHRQNRSPRRRAHWRWPSRQSTLDVKGRFGKTPRDLDARSPHYKSACGRDTMREKWAQARIDLHGEA